jgi:hypothetical protein
LPLFLSHHFKEWHIHAVEYDEVVVEAATSAMGFHSPVDGPRANPRVFVADAEAFLARRFAKSGSGNNGSGGSARDSGSDSNSGSDTYDSGSDGVGDSMAPLYDLIVMDCFDGLDEIPPTLRTPRFARLVKDALHPSHGALMVNTHARHAAVRAPDHPLVAGFDHAFAVSNGLQRNVIMVCGLALPLVSDGAGGQQAKGRQAKGSEVLEEAARESGGTFPFNVGRAGYGFEKVK